MQKVHWTCIRHFQLISWNRSKYGFQNCETKNRELFGARQKPTSKIQSLPVALVLKEPGCCLEMTKGNTGGPHIDRFGISKIWQRSSWTKQWNSFTLQLISGKQQLTAPFGSLSCQAEGPGRGTACEPCQRTPARHTAAARPAAEAPAAVTQAGNGAQVLPSPHSWLFLARQTYWQFRSVLKEVVRAWSFL